MWRYEKNEMKKEEDSRALAIQDQTWMCHPDSKKDQGPQLHPKESPDALRGWGKYDILN